MNVIKVENLSKIYRCREGNVTALDGVSFSVERGEFIAVTGPSGSGKSTLMNLLGCLDKPTGGQYYLNGRDISQLNAKGSARIRNRSIGFVFQSCDLVSGLNAEENVMLPLYYRRVKKAERKQAAAEALGAVGLSDKARRLPHELSGGQRQRVAIARALASKPDMILADEPTGSLDRQAAGEITDIFKKIANAGTTVIVITHDGSVARSADRVITIDGGKVSK